MLSYLGYRRRLLALAIIFSILAAALEGASIGLLIPFLENLLDPGAAPWQTGILWIDETIFGIHAPPLERLYRISAMLLGIVWLSGIVLYLSGYFTIKWREAILDRTRRDVVDQLHRISLSFYSKTRSGEIINTMTSEVQRLRHLLEVARQKVRNCMLFLAYLAASIWISWQLTLIAVLFFALMLGVLNGLLRKLRENGRVIAQSNGRLASVMTEMIGGIRTIAEFGTQDFEAGRFKEVSEEARDAVTNANLRSNVVMPVTQALASTGLVAMIIIAVQFMVMAGTLSTAALLAFLVALLRMIPILKMINGDRALWSVYRGALEDVAQLLRRDNKPYLVDGTRDLPYLTRGIELRHVDFGYEADQRVLKDINLTIGRGKTTAIVGSSGAGKSTLVDLVARLYDPDRGQVLFDGIDVREYKLSTLRDKIAIVNQHTFLFHDTVRANITYGLSDVSDEQLRQVAEKANALDFIEEMPDGFDTVLGDRGVRLSGGQRQRIALARALLRDPEILILDEATSALDSVSERQVQEFLEYLMRDRTVIVIAHRLSTVENADQVVVLEEGRIVEQGTYTDLLEQKGQLWEYHALQFQLV